MEEQVNKKKKFVEWLKENHVLVETALLSLISLTVEGYFLLETKKRCKNLTEENLNLKNENTELRGQIRAVERENRKLGREVENSYYQLGKKSMTK